MIGRKMLATALLGLVANSVGARAPAPSPVEPRVEGPFAHRNLAIYVVRGRAADARHFATLDEGLAAGTVAIRERGARSGEDRARVNELEIENASDQWLFLQAGDVVSGGKQDRTIAIDVAIPPHSAPQPIAAFCVEHGRWNPREAGGLAFHGNTGIVGSNALKRSIQEERSQSRVWAEVARDTARAAAAVAVGGQSPAALSSTGTYNAVAENREIRAERVRYVESLLPRVEKTRDAIGLVVAINGVITAGDVYGSVELFHKLARKLLESYAQEAVLAATGSIATVAAPPRASASAFLGDLSQRATEEKVADSMTRTTRKTANSVVFEYRQDDRENGTKMLLHRNYVKN